MRRIGSRNTRAELADSSTELLKRGAKASEVHLSAKSSEDPLFILNLFAKGYHRLGRRYDLVIDLIEADVRGGIRSSNEINKAVRHESSHLRSELTKIVSTIDNFANNTAFR